MKSLEIMMITLLSTFCDYLCDDATRVECLAFFEIWGCQRAKSFTWQVAVGPSTVLGYECLWIHCDMEMGSDSMAKSRAIMLAFLFSLRVVLLVFVFWSLLWDEIFFLCFISSPKCFGFPTITRWEKKGKTLLESCNVMVC